MQNILPNENAGVLLCKILEILDLKILLEHPSLNQGPTNIRPRCPGQVEKNTWQVFYF